MKRFEEVRDFVRNNPLLPHEDFDFWKGVFDRFQHESKVPPIALFVNRDGSIIKTIYENFVDILTDNHLEPFYFSKFFILHT